MFNASGLGLSLKGGFCISGNPAYPPLAGFLRNHRIIDVTSPQPSP